MVSPVDAMIKCLLTGLVLSPKTDARPFGALLDSMPQVEQRRVLATALKIFSHDHLDRLGRCDSNECKPMIAAVAGAIDSMVEAKESRINHLVEWSTGSSGAGLGDGIAIRRAAVAVLSRQRDAIARVLEKSVNQFGDQLYIKHAPMLQQEGASSFRDGPTMRNDC